MLPSPIFSSFIIIDRIRPTVSNILPWIWFINNLQLWSFFANFVSQLFHWKTDRCKVIGQSVLDLLCRCFHDIDSSFNCVVNVHHGKTGLLFHKTGVFSLQDAIVKYCHSIISCPSSRFSLPTDNPWISYTSHIQSKFLKVVST